ncbi:SidA/IucD/PvdA family monooxygenase [Cellulomonas carbonis]|uniref:L-lysine N6-monooxygenase MbtG n=1 Tax=Cellulomonas carbonis T26 TaxID=947969 RepID=A0A0A0BLM6_9CELL|nr:SidA/IucD/PvdA family monooxygenase [Cellulomonas carbonis]KGM09433.1 hypothetical protein N868_02200 [Cellulomonas carbonis T26]GGB94999.1 lysine 6-monooxygenase [Cellulomonas carbonis]
MEHLNPGSPRACHEDAEPLDLVCVGAGAKGVAVAAKVHALNSCTDMGLRVAVVDAVAPGAHWRGDSGFTSGHETLGTRPEKDVGFPYRSERSFPRVHEALNDEMIRLSWARYLIDRTGYSGWVDAGVQGVTHRRFAEYLSWVVERATNGISHLTERVTRVDRVDDALWTVTTVAPGGAVRTITARAVMVTGPGAVRALDVEPSAAHLVLDARSPRDALAALGRAGARVCVVGAGESASSAALAIAASTTQRLHIELMTSGLVASRAESPVENRVYSDPESVDWSRRSEHERRHFIRRTDRGVISGDAVARLMNDDRVVLTEGRVLSVWERDGRAVVRVRRGEQISDVPFDAVVNCTGFDAAEGVRALLGPTTEVALEAMLEVPLADVAEHGALAHDLALRGVTPPLFVPALAGFAQGPGFANLSSLGLMSDRVVAAVAARRARRGAPVGGLASVDARRGVADAVLR